ncbi:siphovirus ReqiPepy6 Gp37-like family protein [Kurthia senegalensis]|uniref:siphovirus ReqiPepy6 Gp37-like family protein n=1 Tax=Kurthia senegalensis TaxID=1033740 RepID=UPI000288AA4B|nr:siphovirus ReqiPepy6 Gp37-like family protein [Kurthia senegalensis]
MIPLRVIDVDFNLYGEVPKYESLQIVNNLFGIGSIELKINRYMPKADLLEVDRIIFPLNRTDTPFQILHREIELDEGGKATENWVIKAVPLKAWLSDRLILPPTHTANQNKSGNAETVMKHYVNISAVNPIDTKRIIPKLVIAADLKRGDNISRSARFDTLSDELKTIGELTQIGWNISLDIENKRFVFDIIEGLNRVASQTDRPPVVFSTEFKTLESLEYTESKLDYKNTAVVAGQGEGVNRKVIILNDTNSGFDRKEIYIDARDVADTDTDEEGNEFPRPEADVIADLTDRGNEKLAEHLQEIFVNGQITNTIFRYGYDWFNGDTVTLEHKDWGIALDAQITQVKEIHEVGRAYKVEVVFDKDIPTFVDKISRTLRKVADKR